MDNIQLTPPSFEEISRFVVWRTDYYICTGIAYAKSIGKTAEDFTVFLGSTHNWEEFRGKGLEPPVQLLHLLIKSYRGGEFEILTQSDTCVTLRFNRPYTRFFDDGPLLGISLDEFEACLWNHIAIMAERIGLDFAIKIDDDSVNASLSVKD
jgi:hypothetical protein